MISEEIMSKLVYNFNDSDIDSFKDEDEKRSLLGGKGANLANMTRMGLPVPPGFIVTTKACGMYYANGQKITDEMKSQIFAELEKLETTFGKKLGDPSKPLLVSVRSGAKFSMPGMMDTILNLGLNDKVLDGLIKLTNNPRFVYDSYRRFIQMFGNIAKNVNLKDFEAELEKLKESKGLKTDNEVSADDWKSLIPVYLNVYKKQTKEDFPKDPKDQLLSAVNAVFSSWDNKRAKDYRKHEGIPDDLYTAVNVQAMVFGNMGDDSGTGVAFTRNPVHEYNRAPWCSRMFAF